MPWQLIMLFQNLLAASFALVSRKINKEIKGAHFQVVAVIFTVIMLSGIVYGTINDGWEISHLSKNLQLFAFAGLCFGLTNAATYRVLQYMDAGIATILSTLNTLAAVLIATLVLGEGLTIQEAIGALILMFGIWLVMSLRVSKKQKNNWFIGLSLSIVGSIFFGLAVTTEKQLLNNVPLATYVIFGWGFQWLATMALSIINRKKWRAVLKSPVLKTVIGAGFIRTAAGFLFIVSLLKADNLSLISVLSGVKAIFAVILADVFLNERDHLVRKVEGATLVTLGVAIMLW